MQEDKWGFRQNVPTMYLRECVMQNFAKIFPTCTGACTGAEFDDILPSSNPP